MGDKINQLVSCWPRCRKWDKGSPKRLDKTRFRELPEPQAREQLTSDVERCRYVRNILSKDNCKATKQNVYQYENCCNRWRDDELCQVPINVAVEEPHPSVVGEEAERDIVASIAYTHDVADHGIDEVV